MIARWKCVPAPQNFEGDIIWYDDFWRLLLLQHRRIMEWQKIVLILEQEFMSFEDFKHAMDK